MEFDLSSLSERVNSRLLAEYPVPITYEALLDGCICDMCQKVQEMIKVQDRKPLVTQAQAEELNLHENLGASFDLFFRES